MITIGIDAGSRTTKLVLFDSMEGRILFAGFQDTGINPKHAAEELLTEAFQQTKLSYINIDMIYATGYSRNMIDFAHKTLSEISCHAMGVSYFFPGTRLVIDVGGQDSKVITIGEDGKVMDFAMNDKCAAGTGRFLEVTANILHCEINELSSLSKQADKVIEINSTCVVFAESEIIGLISQGNSIPNIINAIHISVVKRLVNLVSQVRWSAPIVFTGGVARNTALVELCGKELKQKISIPEQSIITAALGAAMMAAM